MHIKHALDMEIWTFHNYIKFRTSKDFPTKNLRTAVADYGLHRGAWLQHKNLYYVFI